MTSKWGEPLQNRPGLGGADPIGDQEMTFNFKLNLTSDPHYMADPKKYSGRQTLRCPVRGGSEHTLVFSVERSIG